jgi:Outer membrane protein beta-barrel domain
LRKVAFLFCLFLLGFTGSALAQLPFEAHVGGGWTSPTGDMTPNFQTGGNFLVGGGFNFLPKVELQAEYMYNTFGLSRSFINQGLATDGRAHVNSVTVDPRINLHIPGTSWGVYGLAGAGYYRRTIEFSGPSYNLHNGAFGYNIGGGVTYHLWGPADAFFDVRYHHAATGRGNTQMVPITIGIRF